MKSKNWKLSPSDFAFLWEECEFCFYQKVVLNRMRPRAPMPKVFNVLDRLMKDGFADQRTEELASSLKRGLTAYDEHWVESSPIRIPGYTSTAFIKGRFDIVACFDDGTYGVIDFKTAERNSDHIPLYARQLHAYAHALENPKPGRLGLGPVTQLGILCFEPDEFVELVDGTYAYAGSTTYIDIPRDDEAFFDFLGDVLNVIDGPAPPLPASDCPYCRYRDTA